MTKIPDREHDSMLRDYGGRGFPYLIYMDADGNKIGQPQGRDVESLKKGAAQAQSLLELRAKVAGGDTSLAADLLVAELELNVLTYEEAKQSRDALVAPKKGKRKWKAKIGQIDALLVGLEVDSLLAAAGRDVDARAELQKTFYQMAKDGKVPGKFNRGFWYAAMEEAKAQKDADIFEQGYNAHLEAYGSNSRAKPMLDKLKQELKDLK